jgi:hypothetical protein
MHMGYFVSLFFLRLQLSEIFLKRGIHTASAHLHHGSVWLLHLDLNFILVVFGDVYGLFVCVDNYLHCM